ncbi:MAG: magnesium transporter [archaeon GW2011_AR10]|nr:MAG: magnesium transporter [archaeon GW2011_AR10]
MMLEFLKPVDGSLKSSDSPSRNCWVNVETPTDSEIQLVKSLVNVPDDVFSSLQDADELARLDKYDNFLLLIVKIPTNRTAIQELEYNTVPLGIIINESNFITICFFSNEVIEGIKRKSINSSKRIRLTLKILFASTRTYQKYLKQINRKSHLVQKDLETSLKNEELVKLLTLENSLVYFSTALRSNDVLIEKLSKNKVFTRFEEDRELLEDLAIENKQAVEVTKIYANILSGTMDAFASIISNNLNIVMKFLTTVTILLMIPTLIASIYGMNIDLPFQSDQNAFFMVMLFSVLLSLSGLLLFWRRQLL